MVVSAATNAVTSQSITSKDNTRLCRAIVQLQGWEWTSTDISSAEATVYKPSRLVSLSWVLVSHRPFRLPVVGLPSVRQFSTILSVNEMSSGCYGSAEQGESNDGVTTSLLLNQRGVSLRLTHNFWPVQKGSLCQKLRYHWYSSQSHWRGLLPWQDKVETPSRSFNRKVMLQNWPIPYLHMCTGRSLDKLLAFDP